MKKIKTIKEAIDFLENVAGVNVGFPLSTKSKFYKYTIWDDEINEDIETDKDLIDYANELKERCSKPNVRNLE